MDPSARGGWFRIEPSESYNIPNTEEGEASGPRKGTGKGKKKVQSRRRTTILEEVEDVDSEETREEGFYVEEKDDSDVLGIIVRFRWTACQTTTSCS
ncbi:hypothetical protein AMTR_s00014p00024900 [Amborella trichopoda]|uniref:Uncharacterized protein n=1 Tax=Amborella trichopoda TaxID=13333 RepID=W1PGE6_AMBTC|nr:hypothetical protein AMTR_s00014p00024900 [Amborella trichopoda]